MRLCLYPTDEELRRFS